MSVSSQGISDGIVVFWACVGLVVITIASISWRHYRGQTILRRWASANAYRLHEHEVRWLVRGPFFWTTSRGQLVYRVTVEDFDGRLRRGWVRCGSWLGGLFSNHVDVRWDNADERPGFPVVIPDSRDP